MLLPTDTGLFSWLTENLASLFRMLTELLQMLYVRHTAHLAETKCPLIARRIVEVIAVPCMNGRALVLLGGGYPQWIRSPDGRSCTRDGVLTYAGRAILTT